MPTPLLGLSVLAISCIGIYIAYLFGRKTKAFRWSEYFALIAAPVAGCLALAYPYGIGLIYFFLLSAIVGFVLEYGIGKAYHKTLNRRLWTYGKHSLGGYTSLLTLPMWGVAGVIFWLLAQQVGL
jgi:hypothetical protein